jgi:hypothetical protein
MNQLILGDCLEVMSGIDSEGLEAVEVVRVKVNGVVEREG